VTAASRRSPTPTAPRSSKKPSTASAPRRTAYWLGDSGVTLLLLASLHAQIQERLPDAVADARDQDYSWPEIGNFLALTGPRAWSRYGRPGRRGTPAPLPDD
jgi:hypothetical protein